jgi:tRNA A37 threonylcarbamoyladenosine dehydratase
MQWLTLKTLQIPDVVFKDYYLRHSGRIDQQIFKSKKLFCFGLGALGIEIADCIAKAGVDEIVLMDNQVMKANNAVRHLCTIEDVGLPKIA